MSWSFNTQTERCFGTLTESEEIETIPNAVPESWKAKFEEQGGTHRLPLAEAIRCINGFDVADN